MQEKEIQYDDKRVREMTDAELDVEKKRIEDERRRRGLHTEEKK